MHSLIYHHGCGLFSSYLPFSLFLSYIHLLLNRVNNLYSNLRKHSYFSLFLYFLVIAIYRLNVFKNVKKENEIIYSLYLSLSLSVSVSVSLSVSCSSFNTQKKDLQEEEDRKGSMYFFFHRKRNKTLCLLFVSNWNILITVNQYYQLLFKKKCCSYQTITSPASDWLR